MKTPRSRLRVGGGSLYTSSRKEDHLRNHFASHGQWFQRNTQSVNLETAVGRKKDVQDIGVHGEIKNVVVTSVVMRLFLFCQVRQELARTFVIQLLFLG